MIDKSIKQHYDTKKRRRYFTGAFGGPDAGRGRDDPSPSSSGNGGWSPSVSYSPPAPTPTPTPHVDTAAVLMAEAARMEAERKAIEAEIEAEQQEAERSNQLAEARRLMTQPTDVQMPFARTPISLGQIDPYQQSYIWNDKIFTDPRSIYEPGDYADLVQGPIDVGFQEALRKQAVATNLRQKQQDPDYGQFFRPQPVVEKPSGIMGTVKDKTVQLAKNQAKAMVRNKIMKEFGLAGLNPFLGIGSWLLGKFAPGKKAALKSKFTTKRKVPGVDTQKQATKKLVSRTSEDHEPTIQEAIAGEDVVTETAKKYTGAKEEGQTELRRRLNIIQGILDEGFYQGQELTGRQRNNLLDYIKRINEYLIPVTQGVAYGGRIDKTVEGRNRDI